MTLMKRHTFGKSFLVPSLFILLALFIPRYSFPSTSSGIPTPPPNPTSTTSRTEMPVTLTQKLFEPKEVPAKTTPTAPINISKASSLSVVDYAQILAAFGSLGTLIFLLWQNLLLQRQTRDLSQSIRSATYQNIVSHYVEINKALMTNVELASAFESFDNPEKNNARTKERQRRWLAFWLLNHYENAYVQHQNGGLTDSMWAGIMVDCLAQLKRPYISNLWTESKHLFCDEFRQFMDSQNSPLTSATTTN
jgi:hypothetical protein